MDSKHAAAIASLLLMRQHRNLADVTWLLVGRKGQVGCVPPMFKGSAVRCTETAMPTETEGEDLLPPSFPKHLLIISGPVLMKVVRVMLVYKRCMCWFLRV